MKKLLLICFMFLLFTSLLLPGCTSSGAGTATTTNKVSATSNTSVLASLQYQPIVGDFNTNGDLISGWYWVRDAALQNYAQWTVPRLVMTGNSLSVQINALATNTISGGRGYDANFLLYYGISGVDQNGQPTVTDTNKLKMIRVKLPNISPASDPVGYTCQGSVTLSGVDFTAGSVLVIRVVRESPNNNHVAINKDSIRYYPYPD